MKNSSLIDRRSFVKLGTLAASAALLPTARRELPNPTRFPHCPMRLMR